MNGAGILTICYEPNSDHTFYRIIHNKIRPIFWQITDLLIPASLLDFKSKPGRVEHPSTDGKNFKKTTAPVGGQATPQAWQTIIR